MTHLLIALFALFSLFAHPLMAHAAAGAVAARKVRSVDIQTNQHVYEGSSAPEGEDCSRFKVSVRDVSEFLEHAVAVRDLHDYTFSKCSADGGVVFRDGSTGRWLIMSSRIGYLTMGDGASYSLYCKDEDCRQRVFAGWRGSKSDSDEADDEARRQQIRVARRTAAKRSGKPVPAIDPDNLERGYPRYAIGRVHVEEHRIDAHSMSAAAVDEDCERFAVSASDIGRYLRRASAVKNPDDFPSGGCMAHGTVVFANGKRGEWFVTSSRSGNLFLDDGRGYALYCPDKLCHEPIYGAYRGIDSDLDLAERRPGPAATPR